jgi:hypothetical protein
MASGHPREHRPVVFNTSPRHQDDSHLDYLALNPEPTFGLSAACFTLDKGLSLGLLTRQSAEALARQTGFGPTSTPA